MESAQIELDSERCLTPLSARIPIPAGGGEIGVGANGVWATSWPGSTLMRIDPKTNAVGARMTVKPQSHALRP
jgi:streptogramin lyase